MFFCQLNVSELENSKLKNSFISNVSYKDESIAYIDVNETNKNEIEEIYTQNPFLEDYDVVVFGENVPNGEADFEQVIRSFDMTACAIVVKKYVFNTIGAFNEKLFAISNYEFLVRTSKNFKIYFVQVEIQGNKSNEKANYTLLKNEDRFASNLQDVSLTLAYTIRSNLKTLKQLGLLENIFNYYIYIAQKSGFADIFNEVLSRVLNNDDIYLEIDKDTAPFFVISGDDTCNGVLRNFADSLSEALVNHGQIVIATDGKYGNTNDFFDDKYECYKGIIGFQSPALEEEIITNKKAKRFQFWFDHPAFFSIMFKNVDDDYFVLCQDGQYAKYLRDYNHVNKAIHFPPAGLDAGLSNNDNRQFDIVFIGTFNPVNKDGIINNQFQMDYWNYLKENCKCTFEKALESILNNYELKVSEDEFKYYMMSLHPLCRQIINYYRNAVVETILTAGIKLDVFGDSWKKYDGIGKENLVIHPLVSVEESLKIWGNAKIGLNVMTWHKSGMTERIANIMLSGAVCLSDETTYLRDNFKEDEEIVLFELDKLNDLPDKIKKLLNDENIRKNIAQNAYQKAFKEHTWDVRAKELLELIK